MPRSSMHRPRSAHFAAAMMVAGMLVGAFALAPGCANSASESPEGDTSFHPLETGPGTEILLDVPQPDGTGPTFAQYCGVKYCTPDDSSECIPADGGVFDAGPPETDAEGGTPGSGTKSACRVTRSAEENLVSVCGPAGIGPELSFCSSDADCAPGLACVGTGVCLHYCCTATSASDPICPSTHYCTVLPLKARTDKVPVCVKLDNCTLLEEPSSKCTADTSTCTVVRNDGGTTCVPIGPGGECDDCSTAGCQANFACVGPSDNRRCRKICHYGTDKECASGRCDSVPTIPKGFGLCAVGSGADAGSCKPKI